MGVKPLPITPSLLNTFLTCPRQYEAKYITKEVVFKQTEEAAYGDRVHKAMENALKHGAALTPEAEFMQPFVDWCRDMASRPGIEMFVEERLAVTHSMTPCSWRGDNGMAAWQRGIADVFFVYHKYKLNIVVDWKTGKLKDDKTQQQLLSLCASKRTGYSKTLCMWAFVKAKDLITHVLNLEDLVPIATHLQNVKAYEEACANNAFPPIRNGLCGKWCDVMNCVHNGKNPAFNAK
ncbi:PD-(D/E)XK nuclease family protein [Escherichia coli]|uniref:PD-(D/E)XK nuclease family protein n=1 Tax=Escherichia coli TaxID=562 RepID=UPI001C403FFE|nr:PD-(D/E)XK nuclease family protein [Escherichia coli]